MVLLIIFGFVAGAATALSPCVLPVLPIALSAGATGGRRRPLGIVAGLAVSFTFATVALVYVIDALGLPDDLLRNIAILVLIGFGVVLMIPPLADRVEAWLSRFSGRLRGRQGRRRLLVGDRGRRQPRPRLRPLRRPDPGRRDHGLGLAAVHRRAPRGRAQLRDRLGRGPLRPDARRPPPGGAAGPPRARPADGDGRGDGRRRPGDAGRIRHQVPEPDRQRPAQLPGQPLEGARGHGGGARSAGRSPRRRSRTGSAARWPPGKRKSKAGHASAAPAQRPAGARHGA